MWIKRKHCDTVNTDNVRRIHVRDYEYEYHDAGKISYELIFDLYRCDVTYTFDTAEERDNYLEKLLIRLGAEEIGDLNL
jgi:hypothetical protein